MSIWTSTHRWLSTRPDVCVHEGVVTLSSSRLIKTLSLGRSWRTVRIDSGRRVITIEDSSILGGHKYDEIPFDEVEYMEYLFDSMGRTWGAWFNGFQRQDQIERFEIVLFDRAGTRHSLWHFTGEGSCQTGPLGVILGDDILDMSGTQANDSRSLLNWLKSVLKVPLGKPIPADIMTPCPHCGRAISRYAARCIYCAKGAETGG